MARRRNFTARRAPQRKFVWARFNATDSLAAGATSNLNLLQQFQDEYGAQILGSTVMRIRGFIVAENTGGAVHQLVVAARITGTPNPAAAEEGPLTNPHDDWFMYVPFINYGTGTTAPGAFLDRREVDVKSARKIEELGDALILVAEASSGTAELHVNLSIGIKLQ